METVDLGIIGAGPAGLNAARAAAGRGVGVLVLDENAAAGGQVWRGGAGDRDTAYAAATEAGAAFRFGAAVWDVTADGVLAWSDGRASHRLRARAVLIASGAMERPVAFRGSTLPGVMGVGALQTALKGSRIVPDGPWIVAGSGPLPLLLLAQLAERGVKPRALLDTTPKGAFGRSLRHLPAAARAAPALLARGVGLQLKRRLAGVPVYRGVTRLAAYGDGRLEAVSATFDTGSTMRLETPLLAVHEGVVPQTAIARLLGIDHHWNPLRRAFEPVLDEHGRVAGRMVWIAGDGAGIEGETSAVVQGEIAGIDIAMALGRIDRPRRDRELAGPLRARARERAARRFLDHRFPAPTLAEGLDDATVVCRCERVTAGDIRAAIRDGALGPNRIKTFTRCGMGLCQGRMCGLLLSELTAATTGRSLDEVGALRIRPPLKPVRLAELAALEP